MKETIISQNGIEFPVLTQTAELFQFCSEFADTIVPIKYSTDIMIEIFNTIYIRDLRDYYSGKVMGRSNWTQHTANTFFRTCQLLDFPCDFEVENRHDGAIRNRKGDVYLCAEWEIDEKTIFLKNGEINKLLKTCKKHRNCEAFLFTYNIKMDNKKFIKDVYDLWTNNQTKDENFRLFLTTAIFDNDQNTKINYFKGIRTFIVANGTIDIWEDLIIEKTIDN